MSGLAGPVDICPWTFFAVHSVHGHYLCPWTSYMSMEFCVRKIVHGQKFVSMDTNNYCPWTEICVHGQIIIVHGQEIIVHGQKLLSMDRKLLSMDKE
jgi:hypothetical protein